VQDADPRRLVILGDGLFAEIAHEYFTHDSPYEVVAFAVERGFASREQINGLPVVEFETLESTHPPSEHSVFAALTYTQMNQLRARLTAAAKAKGYALASYVSSRAFVWRNVELGEHCFIFEDNTVQPFVRIGDDVILWSGNHIGHHSTIRDHCFISSHVVVSGSCDVGERCFLGVNSTLVNDITIGSDSWIGPHCVLTRDVPPSSFYRPARSDRREESSFEVLGVDPVQGT
jgi:sugar O-acyltransferase (sialic acid O-acetyltransferase NeuD family)